MAKREKVILVIMFLAVIYAAYALFLSPSENASPVPAADELKELETLIGGVRENLQKQDLSEVDAYILQRVNAKWVTDPFYEMKIEEKKAHDGEPLPEKIHFNYSGYLEVGKKRLGIINGMEYEAGDELEVGGYIVRGIYPTKAVIEIKGAGSKITVPLVEEEVL